MIVAERLCDAAGPGEILASDVVCRIAGPRLAEPLASAGALRLRDVAERVAAVAGAVARTTPPTPSRRSRRPRPIDVVVADDQRLVRAGLRVILDAEADIRVVGEAPDGRDRGGRRSGARALRSRCWTSGCPSSTGSRAAERILGDPELETAVLMLTTFDRDAYIYEALRIGASGFLLKDAPSDRLLDAVRVAAAGDALLAPSVTRRLIEQFARVARPATGEIPAALAELTPRELDVLRLAARGLSNAEIADQLVLGENTVKTHVARVLRKLGLRDRTQAVVVAYETRAGDAGGVSGWAVPGSNRGPPACKAGALTS